MKRTCINCAEELEVGFGLQMKKGCRGVFIVVRVKCNKCEAMNDLSQMLDSALTTTDELNKFMNQTKKKEKEARYIG